MTDKYSYTFFVHRNIFAERERFPHHSGASLTQRIVKTFNMSSFTGFFSDCPMTLRRENIRITFPIDPT